MTRQLQPASLDTSFWIHCYAARLEPYLFDYFQVYASHEVIREATPPYPGIFSVMLPSVKTFHLLQRVNLIQQQNPESTYPSLFGPGESQAIALAQERGYVLLIDDYEPFCYAIEQGITAVNMASFIVRLNHDGIITMGMATGLLNRLRHEVKANLIDAAVATLRRV